eukprot:11228364-Lingulodinium_polyedra.AAC.8
MVQPDHMPQRGRGGGLASSDCEEAAHVQGRCDRRDVHLENYRLDLHQPGLEGLDLADRAIVASREDPLRPWALFVQPFPLTPAAAARHHDVLALGENRLSSLAWQWWRPLDHGEIVDAHSDCDQCQPGRGLASDCAPPLLQAPQPEGARPERPDPIPPQRVPLLRHADVLLAICWGDPSKQRLRRIPRSPLHPPDQLEVLSAHFGIARPLAPHPGESLVCGPDGVLQERAQRVVRVDERSHIICPRGPLQQRGPIPASPRRPQELPHALVHAHASQHACRLGCHVVEENAEGRQRAVHPLMDVVDPAGNLAPPLPGFEAMSVHANSVQACWVRQPDAPAHYTGPPILLLGLVSRAARFWVRGVLPPPGCPPWHWHRPGLASDQEEPGRLDRPRGVGLGLFLPPPLVLCCHALAHRTQCHGGLLRLRGVFLQMASLELGGKLSQQVRDRSPQSRERPRPDRLAERCHHADDVVGGQDLAQQGKRQQEFAESDCVAPRPADCGQEPRPRYVANARLHRPLHDQGVRLHDLFQHVLQEAHERDKRNGSQAPAQVQEILDGLLRVLGPPPLQARIDARNIDGVVADQIARDPRHVHDLASPSWSPDGLHRHRELLGNPTGYQTPLPATEEHIQRPGNVPHLLGWGAVADGPHTSDVRPVEEVPRGAMQQAGGRASTAVSVHALPQDFCRLGTAVPVVYASKHNLAVAADGG